jgi:capsular polysaccharide transport system permease protein
VASFILMVLLPAGGATTYLYTRAADQYHSTTAFSVRSEQIAAAAAGILGAITQMGSGTASDINVLFDFIRSQRIVEIIDAKLDLRTMFNRHPDDLWFSLGKDASIEDLLAYWRRMVSVDLSNAGIIEVRVNAFTPEDAHAIAVEILAESGKIINQLSDQAHEDAVKFSREEMGVTESKLREARQNLADFRHEHHMIDPSGDVQGQVGILNALQAELARAMVERDMILSYADAKDQRVVQADRRITAISGRIEAERNAMESGGVDGTLPEVVGQYEALRVDLEIASTAYTHALAGLAASETEARRQSRYLAAHIQPTLAEKSLYPRRATLAVMVTLFLALGWSIMLLIYYNVRDNNR